MVKPAMIGQLLLAAVTVQQMSNLY